MTANRKNGKYCSRSVNYNTPTCTWIFENQILCRVSKKLLSFRKMLRFVPSKRYKNWFKTFTWKLFLTLSFVLSSYLHVLSIVTSSFPSIELSICSRGWPRLCSWKIIEVANVKPVTILLRPKSRSNSSIQR